MLPLTEHSKSANLTLYYFECSFQFCVSAFNLPVNGCNPIKSDPASERPLIFHNTIWVSTLDFIFAISDLQRIIIGHDYDHVFLICIHLGHFEVQLYVHKSYRISFAKAFGFPENLSGF